MVFKSPVTPMIRGKGSSHIRGMRSFDSVSTCSGWGFSHIGRFRPLRMTIWVRGSLTWTRNDLAWGNATLLERARDRVPQRGTRLRSDVIYMIHGYLIRNRHFEWELKILLVDGETSRV